MILIACPWPIEQLLPHAAPMVLLDCVAAYSECEVVAELEIRPDHPFARDQGLPAHIGIELMAQACGAHAGALAVAGGEPVRLGFLLGTRRYQAEIAWFGFGDRLEIGARRVFVEDGMGVYDCRIERGGSVVAQATLNVYQPPDMGAALGKVGGNNV